MDKDKRFRHKLINAIIRLGHRLVTVLPRACTAIPSAVALWVSGIFLSRIKKIMGINLTRVYGDSMTQAEINRLIRRSLFEFGWGSYEMLYYDTRLLKVKNEIKLDGESHLKEVLQQGRGAVCATAHMGNFPLMFQMMALQGYKVNIVIRPMRNKQFSRFMFEKTGDWGIRMIQTIPERAFIKGSFAALKRNELLFILCDEFVLDDNAVVVNFMGQPVNRPMGPALFYEKLGAAVLPTFTYQENGQTTVTVKPAIHPSTTLSKEEQRKYMIEQISAETERMVRQRPEQWGGWMNKRWAESV